MSQESTLTGRQEKAAILLAADEISDEHIAAEAGVTRRQLDRWKKLEPFQQRVHEHIQELARNLERYSIARKDRRIAAMNDRWFRMLRLIDERAEDGTLPDDLAGNGTGLLVRSLKGKDGDAEEFQADTALLAELRQLEKQAAQEVGQWTEKTDVTSGGASLASLMAAPVVVHQMPDERGS